jgi:hypothetical protein
MDFILERAKSLVSKKLGAAVVGEGVVSASSPELVGYPTLVYIVTQAIVDAVKHYADKRFSNA